MYIHAGNRIIVSDRKTIGIFNVESIKLSDDNERYLNNIKENDKTIIVDEYDHCIISNVSSYTIISRTLIDSKKVWSKENDNIL